MAAITGAVIAAGTAVYSANQAKKGANAIAQGQQAGIGEQQRQFEITQQNLKPWLDQGGWALGQQRAFLEGDMSGWQNSADYKFAVDQGFKGLERGLAAGGALGSGGADADRIALGQGLATQHMGNYWNKLAGMSNTGQTTANQLGSFGANVATNIGNAYANIGQARASAYDARAQGMAGVAGAFNNWYQQRQAAQVPTQAPSNAWASGFGNNTGWLNGWRG